MPLCINLSGHWAGKKPGMCFWLFDPQFVRGAKPSGLQARTRRLKRSVAQVQIPVDELGTEKNVEHPAQGQKRAKGNGKCQ